MMQSERYFIVRSVNSHDGGKVADKSGAGLHFLIAC